MDDILQSNIMINEGNGRGISRVKVVHTGIKVFERSDSNVKECAYRLSQVCN